MSRPAGPQAQPGTPAPPRLVASFLVASLICWLLAALALVEAAPDLARGRVDASPVLLAVHLLALGVLPLGVAGAALHVLPVFLGNSGSPLRGRAGFAGLCAGPFLAVGIARDQPTLVWAAATLVGLGLLVLLVEIGLLVARAPRGRMPRAGRFGVAASSVHALLAFLLGPLLLLNDARPSAGIPHERLIAIHLHLSAIGWLTLLLVTVGRTLVQKLEPVRSERARMRPDEEVLITLGLWLAVLGFAIGEQGLLVAGAAATLAAIARFVAVLVRAARHRRTDAIEGSIAHALAGAAFLVEAAVLALVGLSGSATPRTLIAYGVLLLLGWAAGVTLGSIGPLLSLSAGTWWPSGPRQGQAAVHPRRTRVAEAVAFGLGVQLLAVGVLTATPTAARAGAAALVVSAALALRGASSTLTNAGGIQT